MANKKKPLIVTVATAHWIEGNCISRYLNMHGIKSAVGPAGPRKVHVGVGPRQEARARKLLKKRTKGDCGLIRR